MQDVCTHAATTIPDPPLVESEPIAPVGLLYFARPLELHDAGNKLVNIRAIGWAVGYDPEESMGVELYHYSDRDGPDERGIEAKHLLPRLVFLHVESCMFGQPMLWDVDLAVRELNIPSSAVIASMKAQRNVLRSFWALAEQRIAVVADALPQRHVRRQLERAGSPLATSTVRVVTLRRHEERAEPGQSSPVDWTHRWIVNGFWRNQWLPSRGEHRLQWISPYVKGPADKPLVVKKTVNVLAR